MKNLTKIFVAVAALFVGFACTTDATEDLGVNLGGQTILTLSLEESRTQLGEKVDGVYSLYWSENDQISVNGVASNALTAADAGKANATFAFSGQLSHPYSVVYPAAAANEVTFLASQSYKEGTFCAGAAPMYGYAESAADPIQMKHLAGALRFDVKGSATLSSMVVEAEIGNLAGTYSIDCTNGALTPKEGEISNKVTLSFGEGLALAETATPIYVAIPAGEYGHISVSLNTVSGEKMVVKFDTSSKAVTAGKVREFAEFAFVANAASEFVIDSKEALIAFAANPTKSAVVTANIDMTDVEWTPIADYGTYTFDGGNFEIKGLTAPLFGLTSATIKNVKLTDVKIVETVTPNVGAIARGISSGNDNIAQLVNCSAKGSIVVNCPNYNKQKNADAEFAVGGLVGHGLNLNVANCVNEVSIEVQQSVDAKCTYNAYPCVGGIVGYAQTNSPSSEINFLDCENKADILLAESSDVGEDTIYITTRLGGCVGNLGSGYTAIRNCVNRGAVTQDKSVRNPYFGGVIGATSAPAIEECINYGTVTFKGTTNALYLGGVLGHGGEDQHLDGCYNYGAIITTAEASIYAICCGGIAGNNTEGDVPNPDNRYVQNCTNKGAITFSHTQKADENAGSFRVGGILGWSQGVCENNTNEGAITVNSTFYAHKASASSHCIGGIVAYKTVKPITNCFSKGAIVLNGKMTSNDEIKKTSEAILSIGGLFGYITQTTSSSSNEGCSITVNGEYDALLYVGGFGGRSAATSNLTNKAPITISSTAKMKGLLLGGIAGLNDGKATKDTNDAAITYSGSVDMKGMGDGTNANGCTFFSIGGLIGRGTSATTELTNTENGVVTVGGTFTASYDKKYGYTSIGGVAGTFSGSAHSKLYNYGAMNVTLKVPNASWNEEPFTFGGVVGYVTNNLTDVHNYGNLTFTGTVKSDEPTRIAGVFGRGSNTATHTYTNISNSGKITVSVVSSDHLYVGGIGVLNLKSTYNNVVNKGDITLTSEAKSSDKIFVGGVFAYPSAGISSTGLVANSGKITVSGSATTSISVGGCTGIHPSAGLVHYVNVGEIEVNKVEGCTYYIGGVAATNTVALNDAQSHCNIKAVGCTNVGMLTGSERTADNIVSNGKAGGTICTEKKYDADAYADVDVVVTLDESNFMGYIYGITTDWTGVENYDGCSFLSVKPTL